MEIEPNKGKKYASQHIQSFQMESFPFLSLMAEVGCATALLLPYSGVKLHIYLYFEAVPEQQTIACLHRMQNNSNWKRKALEKK